MNLFEQTRISLLRELMSKDNTLSRNVHRVAEFEALCNMLRQQGIEFKSHLVVNEDEIQYHVTPMLYGDYLAILESMRLMDAKRTPSPRAELLGFDLVDPSPDAPAFWLYTLISADVCKAA